MQVKLTLTRIALIVTAITFACTALAQKQSRPRFEDYPVRGRFVGTPIRVNLKSHPKARLFRTMLREGAKTGPNFAGHYTIVHWGCGSDCRMIAVVDCRNGRVYFAQFTVAPGIGQDFRIDSALFIVNPPERNEFKEREPMLDQDQPSWHVWRGGRFVQLWPQHKRCGTCFAAQQIVGHERRERLSQQAWCGGGCFDSRRRVNSTVRRNILFLKVV